MVYIYFYGSPINFFIIIIFKFEYFVLHKGFYLFFYG